MIANALKGKLLVFSVFFLGMAAGALGLYVYETRMANSAFASVLDRQQNAQSTSHKFSEYLGLSAAQRKQVEEIVKETGADTRKLFEPIRPQADALREQSRNRIRAILTDEQKPKYEQWRTERANRSRNK